MKMVALKQIIVLAAIGWAAMCHAEERIIQLEDGSRLHGEIVSMEDGRYTIRTRSLGDVTIDAARIRGIVGPGDAPVPGPAPAEGGGEKRQTVEAIQSDIAASPGLISKIMKLRDDPEMQAVLSDPEVMEAVRSMDFDALASNPKIKALMESPAMKEIRKQAR